MSAGVLSSVNDSPVLVQLLNHAGTFDGTFIMSNESYTAHTDTGLKPGTTYKCMIILSFDKLY